MILNVFQAAQWTRLKDTLTARPTRTGKRTVYRAAQWLPAPPTPLPTPPASQPPERSYRVKLPAPAGMTAQECQAAYARLSALLRRTAPRAYAVEVLRHPKCLSDGLMVLDCVGEPLDLSQVPAEVLDQLLHLVGHGQWQLAFSESLQFYP